MTLFVFFWCQTNMSFIIELLKFWLQFQIRRRLRWCWKNGCCFNTFFCVLPTEMWKTEPCWAVKLTMMKEGDIVLPSLLAVFVETIKCKSLFYLSEFLFLRGWCSRFFYFGDAVFACFSFQLSTKCKTFSIKSIILYYLFKIPILTRADDDKTLLETAEATTTKATTNKKQIKVVT